MKKQNIAIIAVVALVLAVAVGYALFSQTINITGTATAQGSFDVVWQLEAASGDSAFTYSATCNTGYDDCSSSTYTVANVASLSNNDHTLTITVDKLTYPGGTITIPFRVKNIGTIDAKLKTITQTGLPTNATAEAPNVNYKSTDDDIEVEYYGPATTNAALAVGETKDGYIKVTWKDRGENQASLSTAKSLEFTVDLQYVQAN